MLGPLVWQIWQHHQLGKRLKLVSASFCLELVSLSRVINVTPTFPGSCLHNMLDSDSIDDLLNDIGKATSVPKNNNYLNRASTISATSTTKDTQSPQSGKKISSTAKNACS